MTAEQQYLDTIQYIINYGVLKENRTGTDAIGILGVMHRYNLQEGFPLFTTKKVWFKGVKEELLWFLRGETNIRSLVEKDIHIWDADAYRYFLQKTKNIWGMLRQEPPSKELFLEKVLEGANVNGQFYYGNLGPVYGAQWREWDHLGGNLIDQIANLIQGLQTNPSSRRHILTAWNVGEIEEAALPPCHILSQFSVVEGRLYCHMYQRSADMGLGVPFNVASYSLLTHMIAQVCNLEVGEFIHTIHDAHIYVNHISQLEEQLKREPRPFPTLELNPSIKDIDEFASEDIKVRDYNPYPSIKMEMSGGA